MYGQLSIWTIVHDGQLIVHAWTIVHGLLWTIVNAWISIKLSMHGSVHVHYLVSGLRILVFGAWWPDMEGDVEGDQ